MTEPLRRVPVTGFPLSAHPLDRGPRSNASDQGNLSQARGDTHLTLDGGRGCDEEQAAPERRLGKASNQS